MWSSWPWVMTMRAELVLALNDVGEVGEDEVDTGVVVVGEHDSRVDYHHVVAVLE